MRNRRRYQCNNFYLSIVYNYIIISIYINNITLICFIAKLITSKTNYIKRFFPTVYKEMRTALFLKYYTNVKHLSVLSEIIYILHVCIL